MLILQYKVSFTYDRLGRCFRFVFIYDCIGMFFCVAKFNKHLTKNARTKSYDSLKIVRSSEIVFVN